MVIPEEETQDSQETPKSKVNYFGGFCTGLAILVLLFEFSTYIGLFIYSNTTEIRSLVPTASLLKDLSFANIKLGLTFSFLSYRGTCDASNIIISTLHSHLHIKSLQNPEKSTYCKFSYSVYSDEMFDTGDTLLIYLQNYTSDISVTMSADSSIPGENSITTLSAFSNQNYAFMGGQPTVYQFSISPAYFSNKGFFNEESRKGFSISEYLPPIPGSQYTARYIPLFSGFNFTVSLVQNQAGVNIYRYNKLSLPAFVGSLAGAISGMLFLIAILVVLAEWFYLFVIKKKKDDRKKILYKEEMEILRRKHKKKRVFDNPSVESLNA